MTIIANEEGAPANRVERKGHQRAEGNIRLLAGERRQRTDIDTAEMEYVYAQHDLVRATAEAMESEKSKRADGSDVPHSRLARNVKDPVE